MWDKATWQFINTFADWFAAAGTIAAVIVAIYLARLDKTIRLKVNAGARLMVTAGVEGPHPEYLWIAATNVGHREAQITTISWHVGLLRRQLAVQHTINDGVSSALPVRLRDGEEARWLIPLRGEGRWLEEFVKKFLLPHPKIRSRLVWLVVHTSAGKSVRTRIEKSLRDALLEEAQRQSSA